MDLIAFELHEIEEASLKDGEDEQLEEKAKATEKEAKARAKAQKEAAKKITK